VAKDAPPLYRVPLNPPRGPLGPVIPGRQLIPLALGRRESRHEGGEIAARFDGPRRFWMALSSRVSSPSSPFRSASTSTGPGAGYSRKARSKLSRVN
jgi:hypothetical protein